LKGGEFNTTWAVACMHVADLQWRGVQCLEMPSKPVGAVVGDRFTRESFRTDSAARVAKRSRFIGPSGKIVCSGLASAFGRYNDDSERNVEWAFQQDSDLQADVVCLYCVCFIGKLHRSLLYPKSAKREILVPKAVHLRRGRGFAEGWTAQCVAGI
jgi:hypothetical protein